MDEEFSPKSLKRMRAISGTIFAGIMYLFVSSNYHTANPLEWSRIEREKLQKEINEKAYSLKIDSLYNIELSKCLDYEDSLNFYREHNLPFKFGNPSLKQKEEVLKQNGLEKELVQD